ncbi:MAG: ABC transporter ATP-binding protein, partial [Nannocystaceae bacterium]
MATLFRFTMISLAGILPVVLVGATLYLWTKGAATPGEIVTAGAVSIRIAQMTGWVGFTVMVIYANIGEVEDAMRTLAPAARLNEVPDPSSLNGAGSIV